MAGYSPDSSITGGTQTGFTNPTYTLVQDSSPFAGAKQHAVSALGGTQQYVDANTATKPFTVTFSKPTNLRGLPAANPVTGLRGSIPNNTYKIVIRKGSNSASGVPCTAIFRGTWDIPAGMETYSPQDVRAMQSILTGILNEESDDIGETLTTGLLPA